ncbi:patatin-like phospholipase family protein [Chromobacterium sphagni]|uniref:PNPLA domain-containing protein n=1 Tax=Chromobacterium sphagni TaxID=1903179 RepID=A0ABX3CIQ0_9NEIS|nr:patatin-like phospholipase family protein [Chromobacterium sphagni]OHX22104.1 hypothetical protein BI344_03370 [Chromobacterium sphagni]
MDEATSCYRILSIDGGGLRGIIPLVILDRLDQAVPGWRAAVNMYAGTSTGGMIALGLAKGMAPREILQVYLQQGAKIFSRSWWWRLKTLNGLTGPKYDSQVKERICRGLLGDGKLSSLLSDDGRRGHVLVPAFNLDGYARLPEGLRYWRPKVYHNLPTVDGSDDGTQQLYRVAMETSAAPAYFASYAGFADGGVFANNPAMCALAQTRDARLSLAIAPDAVAMLSLGTGYSPFHLNGGESWGLAQWGPKMADLLMDGINEVADFQVRQMLGGGRYLRVSPLLPRQVALDDAASLTLLQGLGRQADLQPAEAFIRSRFQTAGA